MTSSPKAALLAELRGRIRRLEGVGGEGARVLALGAGLDAALPDGGLPLGCVHEVAAASEQVGPAMGFGAALLARLAQPGRPAVWIGRAGELYAPGLAGYGLTPDRLVVVGARRDADILWAMEEVLRSRAAAAVLGEASELDATSARRLQLAAEAGGVTGLLLRPAGHRVPATAAVTRWVLRPAPSRTGEGMPGIGVPRWHAQLRRCRGGRPGEWLLEWRPSGLVAEAAGDMGAQVEAPPRRRAVG